MSGLKRILLITENIGSGGAERQLCGLAVLLTRYGYRCQLITYCENQFYESYLHQNGVIYELHTELADKRTRVFRLAAYLRKFKPDIVISYLASVNISMCLAKLLCRTKLIVSERNNSISLSHRDKVMYSLYRLADAIVPNSYSQGEFIRQKFPFLSNKIYPIINFVDVNRFRPVSVPLNNGALRIITVARYSEQKNVMTFLKVVRRIKDCGFNVHFDWFGDKDHNGGYYERVLSLYGSLDISDYLSLHDSTPIIEEEYRKFDVFCLPSLFEGYPNVIIEAMASGLPIICSNRFENPYIIKDGENGFLFDPDNIDDIVDSVVKISSLSNEKRIMMGQKNRSLCIVRNSKENFVQSYIKLVETI